jgi:CBS domain containing-hemolysin-like protein
MNIFRAKDLMVPLDEYPVVDDTATVLDAVVSLNKSRRNQTPGQHPHRAVLIADNNGIIVGKVELFSILRALEPRSHIADDKDKLDRAGVGDEILKTALGHFRSIQLGLEDMCVGGATLPVRLVMIPIRDHVDVDTPVGDVIHKMLEWQTMSILVTKDNQPVGLVRLSDVSDVIMKQMQRTASERENGD